MLVTEERGTSSEAPAADGVGRTRVRVLVVDDSGLMRRTISHIVEADGDMQVIATARDGAEGIELADRLRPDVITMDVNMPRLDGLRAVEVIMGRRPVPIVIISSYTKRGGKAAAQALAFGAVEIVEKPSRVGVTLDLDLQSAEIRSKVRAAARVRVIRTASYGMSRRPPPAMRPRVTPMAIREGVTGFPIVAIGASTGGPAALTELLPLLPIGFRGCVMIVQHMPPGYTNDLAHCLDQKSALTVVEARHNDPVVPGTVYIAPGGMHMEWVRDRIKLHEGPRQNMHRPSVDVLFDSLISVPERVQAVLLSGMGDDGVDGMKRLRAGGAATIAQDEASSVVWGMPGAAMKSGCAGLQFPPGRIAEYLCAAVGVDSGTRPPTVTELSPVVGEPRLQVS